ncbi:mannitol dehydrogenase family protein [Psychromicrobium xiongbiense]|uniref:mannitol dehydrogenase family protein n=1 Tax=Psychromicrobium xiongbiense TaxID=3051184 RepID=UPI002556A960|nr:mannitol dehydrogenase family protein [Psychromicrobium sp. YIM S02556]
MNRPAIQLPEPPVRMVHLGLGAFHRAHQLWYTQHASDAEAWGVAAFTMRSPAAAEVLEPQEGLFTLIERGPETDSFEVIWPLVEVGDGSSAAGLERLVELIAAPETAIVSLTVTEAGYAPDAPALRALRRGLEARFAAGAGPLAVMPCDNLSGNGQLARKAVTTGVEAGFADWLERSVSFVSTSVDRITPRTTAAELADVEAATGWFDAAPVVCEPYRSWILEGDFPAGRPQWESVGARFVTELAPWEQRKLWMLNGAHTLLANAGRLRGHSTVAQAVADPELLAAVRDFWVEAAAHLPEDVEAESYGEDLLARFGNARIEHLLAQIAQDSVAKLRVRALPLWRAERAAGRSGRGALRLVEAWVEALLAGLRSPDAEDAALDAALQSADPRQELLRVLDGELADALTDSPSVDSSTSTAHIESVKDPS